MGKKPKGPTTTDALGNTVSVAELEERKRKEIEIARKMAEKESSMLVIEADSTADARAWAANDPYKHADLFESVDIRPWKAALGTTTIS